MPTFPAIAFVKVQNLIRACEEVKVNLLYQIPRCWQEDCLLCKENKDIKEDFKKALEELKEDVK